MDNVNHPNHYEDSTSIECIDNIRLLLGDTGTAYFCFGNAMKYVWRYKHKNGIEDLRKAKWYINYFDENLKDIRPELFDEFLIYEIRFNELIDRLIKKEIHNRIKI